MPADSSERNPPQLPRLRACDQEIINRLFALIPKNTSIRVDQPKEVSTTRRRQRLQNWLVLETSSSKKKREHDKLSGKSILLRSPTAKIESPVLRKAALTEGNPKA
uniref:Uncharacterized protein n=1 Tax=Oryza rufipogon TaxID=4529 RepID=A0A0E0P0K2_ORYRU